MGSSISKSKGSKSSFAAFCEKTTKKASLSSSFVRVEPSPNNKKDSDSKGSRRSKNKKNVTKSIISRPTNFIHLNHAGIDYASLDTLYMPIEQAQTVHITTANTNYAADHSYHSTRRRIENNKQRHINQNKKTGSIKLKKEEVLIKSVPARKNVVVIEGAGSRQINYNTLFSEELYSITRDTNNRICPEMRMATAY